MRRRSLQNTVKFVHCRLEHGDRVFKATTLELVDSNVIECCDVAVALHLNLCETLNEFSLKPTPHGRDALLYLKLRKTVLAQVATREQNQSYLDRMQVKIYCSHKTRTGIPKVRCFANFQTLRRREDVAKTRLNSNVVFCGIKRRRVGQSRHFCPPSSTE